ncbi:MAG: glycosyltransferase family 4 protein [Polaribacter sp.]|uniref:glycosyltransferase family 4 protein n=1 Tax=Polaribacter sp. TaxID=1920175 RepID=UPI002F352A68
MKKKTILFVHQSADLYGSDKALLYLVQKLNKNLFSPIVVLPREGLLSVELKKLNIKVIITPVLNIHKKMFNFKELISFPFNFLKSIFKLNKELKGVKIDIVQSNTVVVILGFVYARLKGIKHFWHIHEVLENPKIAVKVFSRLVKVFSDFTIFNSKTTQESFCKIQPKIKRKSVVIYNGLDREVEITTNKEIEELKKSLTFNSSDILLGLVGRINENKGHALLLNAFKELEKKQSNAKLLFIGSTVKGKEDVLETLEKQIETLNLSAKVKIINFQTEIWKFWDIIDIAVVPSTIPESFGLVALEAMLSKKPVIASNLGALKEVVEDNKTGLLFNVENVESLTIKMNLLLNDASLRNKYSTEGFLRAKKIFTLEKYVNQFELNYLKDSTI